jgi:hypothetical protein
LNENGSLARLCVFALFVCIPYLLSCGTATKQKGSHLAATLHILKFCDHIDLPIAIVYHIIVKDDTAANVLFFAQSAPQPPSIEGAFAFREHPNIATTERSMAKP